MGQGLSGHRESGEQRAVPRAWASVLVADRQDRRDGKGRSKSARPRPSPRRRADACFSASTTTISPTTRASWIVAVSGAGRASEQELEQFVEVVPLIALAIGLVLVALIIWWAVRRRRKPSGPAKPRKATPAPKPKAEPQPEPALAAAAAIAASRASSEPRPSGTPLDPESTDVNIFKVELADRATLEVGYNFFPEGTTVTWRVAQNGATFASGDFVTQGGGADRHFETIPLGVTVGPDTRSVDVYFSWRIGDVPFGYNVRRDTDA